MYYLAVSGGIDSYIYCVVVFTSENALKLETISNINLSVNSWIQFSRVYPKHLQITSILTPSDTVVKIQRKTFSLIFNL